MLLVDNVAARMSRHTLRLAGPEGAAALGAVDPPVVGERVAEVRFRFPANFLPRNLNVVVSVGIRAVAAPRVSPLRRLFEIVFVAKKLETI
jgi:hypothetical protein